MTDNNNVVGARYSAISAAENCQLSAWLTYSQGKKGYKNKWAKLGTVIHEVLELYGKHCLKTNQATDYGTYDGIVDNAMLQLPESQLKDARQIFENIKHTTNWQEIIQYGNVDIEDRIRINEDMEYDPESNYYSGAIDLLYIDDERTLHVIDYKSVRTIYSENYMEESLQRKAYSFIAAQKYAGAIDRVAFQFNFVRYAYLSKPYIIEVEDLDKYKNLLKLKIEDHYKLMAQKEEPEANPSGFCILCENKGLCKSYQNAFGLDEQIENEDDAKRLLGEYKLAKLKLENVQELLKKYVDINGPIIKGKDLYGPKPEEHIKFEDAAGLIKGLQKLEIPDGAIYDILSSNKTKISKLVKKFKLKKEDIEKLFDTYGNKKTITKMKFQNYDLGSDESDEDIEESSDAVYDRYI